MLQAIYLSHYWLWADDASLHDVLHAYFKKSFFVCFSATKFKHKLTEIRAKIIFFPLGSVDVLSY